MHQAGERGEIFRIDHRIRLLFGDQINECRQRGERLVQIIGADRSG